MDSMTASEAVDPGLTPGGPTILTSGHRTKWPRNELTTKQRWLKSSAELCLTSLPAYQLSSIPALLHSNQQLSCTFYRLMLQQHDQLTIFRKFSNIR